MTVSGGTDSATRPPYAFPQRAVSADQNVSCAEETSATSPPLLDVSHAEAASAKAAGMTRQRRAWAFNGECMGEVEAGEDTSPRAAQEQNSVIRRLLWRQRALRPHTSTAGMTELSGLPPDLLACLFRRVPDPLVG